MKLYIPFAGPAAAEAALLAEDAGWEITKTKDAADFCLPVDEELRSLCCSKRAVNERLAAAGVPLPADFPEGSEPYLVKPDDGRNGQGIWTTADYCEVGGAVNAGFVTQEERAGTLLSVAVRAGAAGVEIFPPVELLQDDRYCRIGARYPADLSEEAERLLRSVVEAVAEALRPTGFMEIKAVWGPAGLAVISVNEGLPVLAASALWYGAGISLVTDSTGAAAGSAVVRCYKNGSPCALRVLPNVPLRTEHRVEKGEHILDFSL